MNEQRTKFMTNIFRSPNQRTTQIKFLKTFKVDEAVQFNRLIVGLFAILVIAVSSLLFLMKDTSRLIYVLFPVLIIDASLLYTLVIYLVNLHGKSLLFVSLKNFIDKFIFKKNHFLQKIDFGINKISDNMLVLDNGKVCVSYHVRGILSESSIESTFYLAAKAKDMLLRSLPMNTLYTVIISLKEDTFSTQIDNVLDSGSNSELAQTINALQYDSLINLRKSKDTRIDQTVLITAENQHDLQSAMRQFGYAVQEGLFSEVFIMSHDELKKLIYEMNLGGEI